ncbi:TonB-dependent hemoglobin/transferrin/lactoferrin family receptor [Pseudomonas sp. LRF_L74]|uniref:TonB-dependent receptor n=1 Tax=Pseudomonas sp. LRF_L74 TaxID=3369422 RepID=UPI003F61543B
MSNKGIRHQVARAIPACRSVGLASSLVIGAILTYSATTQAEQATSPAVAASSESQQVEFNIPAQPLGSAVIAFAEQAGIEVFFDSGKLAGLQSHAVKGRYSPRQALDLLLGDLPVSYGFAGNKRVNLERLASGTEAVEIDTTHIEAIRDKSNDWIYRTPQAVSVITREQLDRNPPRHAADMLVETPGVYSAVSAQDPGLSVNIRGMQDFGRVNTMIDGMRQNFNENGHQQRNGQLYVDPELISEVVIEKGPSSGVHGAGAIAGSANFGTLGYDDIILPGNDLGVRLRGMTGVGGYDNGVKFIGSAALAGRLGEALEVLVAKSQRNFGDYEPGRRKENFDFLLSGVQDGANNAVAEQVVDRVKFSDQKQDSDLFKLRLHLTPEQSLQFTYIGTEISYNNVSDRRVINQSTAQALDGDEAWIKYGDALAESKSYGIDYSFNPDSDLIDLKAKLYYVDTSNQRETAAGRPEYRGTTNWTELAWMIGVCNQNPIQDDYVTACERGYGNETDTSIKTYGFTLENTARFAVAGVEGFSFNHGLEYFQDKGSSTTTKVREGADISGTADNSLNPNGKRSIASAFGNLKWENETYTIAGGLRYDHYQLKGKTRLPVTEWTYVDRYSRAQAVLANNLRNYRLWCSQATRPGYQTYCANIIPYEGYVNDPTTFGNYLTDSRFRPQWMSVNSMDDYNVDKQEHKVLPSLSLAYRPTDWLELFSNWGKSWRPPALTESLMQGNHPSDPFATMLPNPFLETETSRSWDIGFNLAFQDVISNGDKLNTKVAYYDTRVDNYMVTSIVNIMPGYVAGLGNTMFVNNLLDTKFRGLEFELDYDAGRWYSGVNYTHVIGGNNDFCQKTYPLGSGYKRGDMPDENGVYPAEHQAAIAAGYASYEAYLDNQQLCGDMAVFGMNSARNVPMDRGSWVFGTRWFNQALEVGTRLNYSAAGGPDEYEYDVWPSYITWDLFASLRINQNVMLRATVENLRDRSYVSGYSDIFSKSYGTGRTVMAGLEVNF